MVVRRRIVLPLELQFGITSPRVPVLQHCTAVTRRKSLRGALHATLVAIVPRGAVDAGIKLRCAIWVRLRPVRTGFLRPASCYMHVACGNCT